MSPDAIASVVAAVATGGFAAWGARSARRTKRQERRDDFTAVTDRMERDIARQDQRIDELETESADQRKRLSGQEYTIRYLITWVRDLVGYIRLQKLEPPVPRQPMPTEVRQYMDDIGA
jgi:uncharacterized coiled-coil protein SlyX